MTKNTFKTFNINNFLINSFNTFKKNCHTSIKSLSVNV